MTTLGKNHARHEVVVGVKNPHAPFQMSVIPRDEIPQRSEYGSKEIFSSVPADGQVLKLSFSSSIETRKIYMSLMAYRSHNREKFSLLKIKARGTDLYLFYDGVK